MQAALADMDAVCCQAFTNLLEGEIGFVGHQLQQPIFVRQKLGRRMTMHRLRLNAARITLALHPFDRRRSAHLMPARCSSCSTAGFNGIDQTFA